MRGHQPAKTEIVFILYFLLFLSALNDQRSRVFNQANEHPFKCWYNKIVLKLRRHMQSFFFLFHSHGCLR